MVLANRVQFIDVSEPLHRALTRGRDATSDLRYLPIRKPLPLQPLEAVPILLPGRG